MARKRSTNKKFNVPFLPLAELYVTSPSPLPSRSLNNS